MIVSNVSTVNSNKNYSGHLTSEIRDLKKRIGAITMAMTVYGHFTNKKI